MQNIRIFRHKVFNGICRGAIFDDMLSCFFGLHFKSFPKRPLCNSGHERLFPPDRGWGLFRFNSKIAVSMIAPIPDDCFFGQLPARMPGHYHLALGIGAGVILSAISGMTWDSLYDGIFFHGRSPFPSVEGSKSGFAHSSGEVSL